MASLGTNELIYPLDIYSFLFFLEDVNAVVKNKNVLVILWISTKLLMFPNPQNLNE